MQCAAKENTSKPALTWCSASSPLLLLLPWPRRLSLRQKYSQHGSFASQCTIAVREASRCAFTTSDLSYLSKPPDLDSLHFENTNGSTKAMNVIGPRLTLMGKATERPCIQLRRASGAPSCQAARPHNTWTAETSEKLHGNLRRYPRDTRLSGMLRSTTR